MHEASFTHLDLEPLFGCRCTEEAQATRHLRQTLVEISHALPTQYGASYLCGLWGDTGVGYATFAAAATLTIKAARRGRATWVDSALTVTQITWWQLYLNSVAHQDLRVAQARDIYLETMVAFDVQAATHEQILAANPTLWRFCQPPASPGQLWQTMYPGPRLVL